jgi:hypothetical protein
MSPGGRSRLFFGGRSAVGLGHAMNSIVVRYTAKPERANENQELIEAVFAELDERTPKGSHTRSFAWRTASASFTWSSSTTSTTQTPCRMCRLSNLFDAHR